MDSIRISIIQTDIVWENKQENLRLLHEKLQNLRGTTEIVVLPEMFSTGFSMQSQLLAEPNSGETITILKQWASRYGIAICGSYIAIDNGQFYNRAFFLAPEGTEFYYDKRHLFRMGRVEFISSLYWRTKVWRRSGSLQIQSLKASRIACCF